MEYITELYQQLERQLDEIDQQGYDALGRAKLSSHVAEQALMKLKTYISTHTFAEVKDEIHFFKELKPKFYSKLIYYVRLFSVESEKPSDSARSLKKYLHKQLSAIRRYTRDHLSFYKYYRSGADYLDDTYFKRTKHDIMVGFDLSYFDCDQSFCTSHDFTVANLLANELLANHLNDELQKLEGKQPDIKASVLEEFGLNWADTKASFIELLYALQTLGVFYNSKTKTKSDISQVARFFETVLAIDLGNYYRTFQEIRIRKKGRTAFIDKLKEQLIQRMDDTDENPR